MILFFTASKFEAQMVYSLTPLGKVPQAWSLLPSGSLGSSSTKPETLYLNKFPQCNFFTLQKGWGVTPKIVGKGIWKNRDKVLETNSKEAIFRYSPQSSMTYCSKVSFIAHYTGELILRISIFNGEMVFKRLLGNSWSNLDDFFSKAS